MSAASKGKGRRSIGIDIGGTFTDVVLMDANGRVTTKLKVDTTPKALELCFIRGLERASEGLKPESIANILHATTVATNTVLEGKGAKTALVTTKGFRDLLEIARQRRPSLYDLKAEKAKPLVPRRLSFEIEERIGADGRVRVEPTEAELQRLADALEASGAESIVIALLFSYLNPSHEQKIKAFLERALPNRYVVASSDVIPEFREFERASTAVLVGYLRPIFEHYTRQLEHKLEALGHGERKLLIMNSAGGLMSPVAARERPHTIVESGPAAGVIAAATLARDLDEANVISFDMGGTTAKASLIEGGRYRTTTEYEIGAGVHQSMAVRFTGYPIKAPMIDLTECSAGGGSIASVDGLGMLKVGPRSAGADPGPVCYGRGGTEPTVTDANLVLGRLNPEYFVGGEAQLDPERAAAAIEAKIARPLGLSLTQAAAGIIEVVNAQMVRILRVVSVSRGFDPRDFSLVAFGGAGPLHAASLAAELEIPRVIVPDSPGLFSALGLLWADLRADFGCTVRRRITPATVGEIAELIRSLETEAEAWLQSENVPANRRRLLRSADMRYPLQNYEINVPLPGGRVDGAWIERAATAFHDAHERLYSYCDRREGVDIVNMRVAAVGETHRPHPEPLRKGSANPSAAKKSRRSVYFHEIGDYADTTIYERERLEAGNRIKGPAIIEQADSTIVVPPPYVARVDDYGRIVMTAAKEGKKSGRVARAVEKISGA